MGTYGETNLEKLIKGMKPILNKGDFVFSTLPSDDRKLLDSNNSDYIGRSEVICEFKEKEGVTLVLEKSIADKKKIYYEYVAAWISLEIHSSLDAVGLTAAFSN